MMTAMTIPVHSSTGKDWSCTNLDEVGYNWEELGKLAKDLERNIDAKLLEISRLITAALCPMPPTIANNRGIPSPSNSSHGSQMATEGALLTGIESSLKRLGNVIDMMSELLEQVNEVEPAISNNKTISAIHLLNRHREIYQEYQKELRKLKTKLANSKEQAELLNSVRDEINAYRKDPQSAQDYLLAEKERMERMHNRADHIIDVAHAAHSNLTTQRAGLKGAYRKFQTALDRLPIISATLSKIRFRRMRDIIVLGIVIACCVYTIYLLW